ncbi:enolase-phosphatase E1 [Centruroides vittatus]|uniref:enolase-phosphatase E1 n=1 Tax=Centruroides vittatus TaxID=120091 RepID=UPI0035109F7D
MSSLKLENINVCLLDIEGTTTSISFVKNTLFPYARSAICNYLKQFWGNSELMETIEALKKQVNEDKQKGIKEIVEIEDLPESPSEEDINAVQKSIVNNIMLQMDYDRKTTALKQLQGQMWRIGYKNGEIKSHVYEDVPSCLESWKKEGKQIYIYSSGSVEAQKLLFQYSNYGNLLQFIDGHFDTNTGQKFDHHSYVKIAEYIGVAPENILFLTDVTKEADAALKAKMQVAILLREGNAPLSNEELSRFNCISSFHQLQLI